MIDLIWPYVVGGMALVAAYFGIRQNGKHDAEKDRQIKELNAIRKAKENRENIEILDDDSLANEFDRLHDKRRR